MHQSRAQAEFEATPSHATRNRLVSVTLSELLDERKAATSRKALESIANKFGMDIAKLDSLARFVNTPTIGETTIMRNRNGNGEEIITSTVSRTIHSYDRDVFGLIVLLGGVDRTALLARELWTTGYIAVFLLQHQESP